MCASCRERLWRCPVCRANLSSLPPIRCPHQITKNTSHLLQMTSVPRNLALENLSSLLCVAVRDGCERPHDRLQSRTHCCQFADIIPRRRHRPQLNLALKLGPAIISFIAKVTKLKPDPEMHPLTSRARFPSHVLVALAPLRGRPVRACQLPRSR